MVAKEIKCPLCLAQETQDELDLFCGMCECCAHEELYGVKLSNLYRGEVKHVERNIVTQDGIEVKVEELEFIDDMSGYYFFLHKSYDTPEFVITHLETGCSAAKADTEEGVKAIFEKNMVHPNLNQAIIEARKALKKLKVKYPVNRLKTQKPS